MRVDVGIIGGTGIGDRILRLGGTPVFVPTRAGLFRGRVIRHEGAVICVASRHSAGHKVPPHKVNYAACALGLSSLGATTCLGTAAVGALRPEWKPGTLVCCSDFVDLTARGVTLFRDAVVHRDFTHPFGKRAREELCAAGRDLGTDLVDNGVYFGLNGPRFETPAEISVYRTLGADVVGMTATSEAIVMREAEIEYACLAIVTNLAAGLSGSELTHVEVVSEMERTGDRAVEILLRAASRLARPN